MVVVPDVQDTSQMSFRASVAAVFAALLLAAACGGGGDDTASADRDTTTSTTENHDGKAFEKTGDTISGADPVDSGEAPAGCTVDSGDADALVAFFPEGPAGFELQADDVGDTGPSDLDKAVADDGEDDAAASLTESGFLAGYQRYWIDAGESDLVGFLYAFCDGAGAQHYLDRTIAEGDLGAGVHTFTPAGLSGAFGQSGVDEGYTAAQVSVVHDRYLVMAQSGSMDVDDEGTFEVLATNLVKDVIGKLDAA
jgi:hypothetical protein